MGNSVWRTLLLWIGFQKARPSYGDTTRHDDDDDDKAVHTTYQVFLLVDSKSFSAKKLIWT